MAGELNGHTLRIRRTLGDALLVGAVAAAVDLRVLASAGNEQHPGGVGYVFGPLIALGLFARWRWPMATLGWALALLLIYHATGNPGMSPVLALAVPVYAAAHAGRLWWATGAAGVAVAVASVVSLTEGDEPVVQVATQRLLEAALLAVLLLLGETRRMRGVEARRSRQEAARIAADKDVETRQRLAEQRLEIARELHDVLAHTLAAASIQASVAADTLDDDPATSRAAIDWIRQACRDARAELAAAVGLLRADGTPNAEAAWGTAAGREPAGGLDQLDGLLHRVGQAGLQVALHTDGEAMPVPPEVGLTAYRVVQEALTNVVRHSGAHGAEVRLTYRRHALQLDVEDPGPARSPSRDDGFGLLGMRERVAAIGGRMHAGGTGAGGYRVAATLPLRAVA
jgi:signal transduction histidine kinase